VSSLIERFQDLRPFFDVLNATSSVLSIITWLVAIPFLIVAWRRSKQISVRVFGIEATFEQGLEAAAAIGAAAERRSAAGEPTPEMRPATLARSLERVVSRLKGRGLRGKSVLWVDDTPSNNEFESQALRAFGIAVTFAVDTEPALKDLSARKFDLVISDMARPSSKQAGYALLDAMRTGGNKTPVLIYSSSNAPEHKREAERRGASGATNNPQELVEMALGVLAQGGG
jgi:CheY-like chemotaxis protein